MRGPHAIATDGATRHCWLRLRRHTYRRTEHFDSVVDGQSPRIWVVEWVVCTRCGYETTQTVDGWRYK